MKHTYLFILGDDQQVASIESDGPLPHLKIGVHLDLDSDDYRGTPGTHLEIEDISVVLHQIGGKVVRNDVCLHCAERPGLAN
ncbi:hypothetical protein HBN82_20235 [Pseudomonas lundensis]|uniref:hypothetical protein n=1 Tax=Pseudomonas TaxID=286 RepID=UPI0014750A0C|nr:MULTISPECIES: hypothetical protein [Pseudomonas]MBS5839455.1 hypothetical protein [Pseudomonas sp.]NNA18184.1 hypothetical protein [Pseudomonas lundensis]